MVLVFGNTSVVFFEPKLCIYVYFSEAVFCRHHILFTCLTSISGLSMAAELGQVVKGLQ